MDYCRSGLGLRYGSHVVLVADAGAVVEPTGRHRHSDHQGGCSETATVKAHGALSSR